MSTPGLSIVIVNWNTKELLLQVLGDILPPVGGRAVEVIVVDNASSDGSLDAARAAFPDVRYLAQETNLGFAAGVNAGFAAVRAPMVLLLNTDLRASAAGVAALCAYAEAHPEVGIVGPHVLNEDGTDQDSYWRFPSLWRLLCSATGLFKLFPRSELFNGERYGGARFAKSTAVDAVSGCVFLVRRAVIDRVGGLDEGYFMYFEETDLCKRARDAGFEVRFAPVARFTHFLGGSTKLARRHNFLEFRRSLIRYHRIHGGPVPALAARALLLLSMTIRIPYWSLRSLILGAGGRAARRQLQLYLAGISDLVQPARQRSSRTEPSR